MMLSGQDIRAAGVILGAMPTGYRASSYDVRVGQIITNNGEVHASFCIPPQGIVQVISVERIKLPHDLSGLATVKTSLCNDGLLALNIGIVDPGYSGRISSFLVNFANVSRVLTQGESFLRLQFVHLPNGLPQAGAINDIEYIASRRQAATRFGETFLNLSEAVRSAVQSSVSGVRNSILAGAGAAALALGLLTFLLNFSSLYMVRGWLQTGDAYRGQAYQEKIHDQINEVMQANIALKDHLDRLEARLNSVPNSAAKP
jgi:dUTPase